MRQHREKIDKKIYLLTGRTHLDGSPLYLSDSKRENYIKNILELTDWAKSYGVAL